MATRMSLINLPLGPFVTSRTVHLRADLIAGIYRITAAEAICSGTAGRVMQPVEDSGVGRAGWKAA